MFRVAQRVGRMPYMLVFCTVLILSSCGGPNIGQSLDDLQGKITSAGGILGHTTGLAEEQAFDILKLRIQELRVQLKDSLNESINTLDTEQSKTLDNLRKGTDQVHSVINHATKLEDLAVLDVNAIMSKFGLSVGPEIRRVEPSALTYKRSGYYSYVVTLPLFGTGNTITGIRVNNIEVMQFKSDLKPHGFRLDIPVGKLEPSFDDWKLMLARLEIDLQTPTSKWWKPWAAPIKQTLLVSTGLFPRYPLRYWFAEHPHHSDVDSDPAHVQVMNSPQTLIPGCGNSGCYLSYNVCAAAPVGAQPVGDAYDPHDSFNGWGQFIGNPVSNGNLTCWTYQQHSHNQNRNVWFSAHYRPLKDVTDTVYYVLTPLTVPSVPLTAKQAANFEVARANGNASMLSISSMTFGASMSTPSQGDGPVSNSKYFAPSGDTGPVPRPMAYEFTYFGPYHIGVNYELVVQAFTGDTITLTPTAGGGPKSQLDVAPENGERLRIQTKAPW